MDNDFDEYPVFEPYEPDFLTEEQGDSSPLSKSYPSYPVSPPFPLYDWYMEAGVDVQKEAFLEWTQHVPPLSSPASRAMSKKLEMMESLSELERSLATTSQKSEAEALERRQYLQAIEEAKTLPDRVAKQMGLHTCKEVSGYKKINAGFNMVDHHVAIWWKEIKEWRKALVLSYNPKTLLHSVRYFEDKEVELVQLSHASSRWRIVKVPAVKSIKAGLKERVRKDICAARKKFQSSAYAGTNWHDAEESATEGSLAMQVIKRVNAVLDDHLMRVTDLFRGMDDDDSGVITFTELRNGLSHVGLELTDEEFAELVKVLDDDGSGDIGYNELYSELHHAHHLHHHLAKHKSRKKKRKELWEMPAATKDNTVADILHRPEGEALVQYYSRCVTKWWENRGDAGEKKTAPARPLSATHEVSLSNRPNSSSSAAAILSKQGEQSLQDQCLSPSKQTAVREAEEAVKNASKALAKESDDKARQRRCSEGRATSGKDSEQITNLALSPRTGFTAGGMSARQPQTDGAAINVTPLILNDNVRISPGYVRLCQLYGFDVVEKLVKTSPGIAMGTKRRRQRRFTKMKVLRQGSARALTEKDDTASLGYSLETSNAQNNDCADAGHQALTPEQRGMLLVDIEATLQRERMFERTKAEEEKIKKVKMQRWKNQRRKARMRPPPNVKHQAQHGIRLARRKHAAVQAKKQMEEQSKLKGKPIVRVVSSELANGEMDKDKLVMNILTKVTYFVDTNLFRVSDMFLDHHIAMKTANKSRHGEKKIKFSELLYRLSKIGLLLDESESTLLRIVIIGQKDKRFDDMSISYDDFYTNLHSAFSSQVKKIRQKEAKKKTTAKSLSEKERFVATFGDKKWRKHVQNQIVDQPASDIRSQARKGIDKYKRKYNIITSPTTGKSYSAMRSAENERKIQETIDCMCDYFKADPATALPEGKVYLSLDNLSTDIAATVNLKSVPKKKKVGAQRAKDMSAVDIMIALQMLVEEDCLTLPSDKQPINMQSVIAALSTWSRTWKQPQSLEKLAEQSRVNDAQTTLIPASEFYIPGKPTPELAFGGERWKDGGFSSPQLKPGYSRHTRFLHSWSKKKNSKVMVGFADGRVSGILFRNTKESRGQRKSKTKAAKKPQNERRPANAPLTDNRRNPVFINPDGGGNFIYSGKYSALPKDGRKTPRPPRPRSAPVPDAGGNNIETYATRARSKLRLVKESTHRVMKSQPVSPAPQPWNYAKHVHH